MENELLKQISQLLDDKLRPIHSKLNSLESGKNEIIDRLVDIESKNATKHTEIYNSISSISKDLKFIKHKLHETEEDVFDIKDHLKLVK